jgi:3',5'-cyclic AMP phosphodiesterase CpdA
LTSDPHVATSTLKEEPYRVIVASDLHFISPSLTDNGEKFTAFNDAGDGKTMLYSSEVVAAFLSEVEIAKPDALILSGDLSFNGAYASNADLAKQLSSLTKEGIAVLVLPGNHDINNPNALSFSGKSYAHVRSTTSEDFERLYWQAGYQEAISRDRTSLSYVYEARKDLQFLFLDTNSVETDVLEASTAEWMERELALAQSKGIKTIGVTHQNVLVHNPLFLGSNVIEGRETILSSFQRHGVKVNLAGHLHIQHISEAGETSEILTSSLMVAPNHYASLSFDGEKMVYRAQSVDVASWAARTGKDDSILRDFATYSQRYFDDLSQIKVDRAIGMRSSTESEREALSESFIKLNAHYFAGMPTDLASVQNGVAAWQARPDIAYSAYVLSVVDDSSRDYTQKTIAW